MSGAANPHWEEVERAIGAVLELPEEQRAAYLARQPDAIRAEVESLLAAYRRSGDFLASRTGALSSPGTLAVKPGDKLGPYRIESVIGEGGMGVVYRALDTRLNRPVAVKLLFDDLADTAARRRFQREAQMASSLNHPHILTVHDAGDFEGRQYLVTELIEGGTLKDWSRQEKRGWRETVALLVGVADGLATAHAAGILHRDIKPDNILVGRNGYAKLSDFGLAKLQESSPPDTNTQSTRPGIVLGTIAYMSPEQASGRSTDARSDIFSFGVVLYELLAGRRPFEGATDLELLQTVIHGSPAPLPADFPLALRMIVEKALERAPAERYQSTGDFVVDLRRLARASEEAQIHPVLSPAGPQPVPRKRAYPLPLAALVVLVLLLAGGMLLLWLQRPTERASRQVVQFDISPPPGTIFAPPVGRQAFAISPDGTRLAFTATGSNGTNVWIRDLASSEMRPVPGTEGVWSVFWPLDGRSVFYSVNRTLRQANLETGSGRSVAELVYHAQLGTWRPNGDVWLYLGRDDNYLLRAEDGSVRKITPDQGVRWPEYLPGGDRFVYVAYDPATHGNRVMAADYAARKPVSLMQTDSRAQYAPPRRPGESGHLLFIRAGSLLAQPFDAERLRLTGESFPIAQNVVYYGPNLAASFSVSANGVLVYQAGFPNSDLKWYDRTGRETGVAGRAMAHWGNARISPDGRRVAAAVWGQETGGAGVWIFDTDGRESRRLTFPPEVHRRPVWSPNGLTLALGRSTTIGSGPRLGMLDLGGNGSAEPFGKGLSPKQSQPIDELNALPTDWSRDGRFIAIDDGVGAEVHDVWIADVTGAKVMPFLQNQFQQWGVAFSPDGRRAAFVSVESGRPEVYVQAFDANPSPHITGERRQVSKDGAWLVRWRADGRELFFVGMDNSLVSVPVLGPLEFGRPAPLFHIAGAPQYGATRDFQFDVSPDGRRFIMPTTGTAPPPPFTVVENWQDKFHR
jgi:serine/threonine protein kinase/Tol biopolymer transport system component